MNCYTFLILLPSVSLSKALSHHPFPRLFVAVSDTSYSASHKYLSGCIINADGVPDDSSCEINRRGWRRRLEEEEVTEWSKNHEGVDDRRGRLCLTTPTSRRSLKNTAINSFFFFFFFFFNGGVNRVNLMCWWSNNKNYTIISLPRGSPCLPLDAVFLQSCYRREMNLLNIKKNLIPAHHIPDMCLIVNLWLFTTIKL